LGSGVEAKLIRFDRIEFRVKGLLTDSDEIVFRV
jgi:hypothetical protein